MSRATFRRWIFGLCFVGALLCSFFLSANSAQAQGECQTVLEGEGVEMVSCPIASDEVALILTVSRSADQAPLHIEAVAREQGSDVSILSFRLTGGGAVSEQDQTRLRDLISRRNTEQMNVGAQKFLSLVVDLIHPGEWITDPADRELALHHTESPPALDGGQSSYLGSYTMICASIGRKRLSTYAVEGQTYAQSAVIGTVALECLGRCGPGCEDSILYIPTNISTPRNV